MTVRQHSVCLMSPPTLLILVLLGFEVIGGGRASRLNRWESGIRMPTEKDDAEEVDGEVGTRWAVLVAGSSGYGNYRHQVFFFFSYGHDSLVQDITWSILVQQMKIIWVTGYQELFV